jgi:ArsR family transcriptional regulator, arsenate/arsenite/antimonite-responsive transcriptional repressor
MREFIKVMKALSDPSRVKIIKLLQHKMLCVCEIQAALGLAQSTVSKHLKIMEDADLITSFKDGLWVNYQPGGRARNPFAAGMLDNLRYWLEDDPDLAPVMERLPGIDRKKLCGTGQGRTND